MTRLGLIALSLATLVPGCGPAIGHGASATPSRPIALFPDRDRMLAVLALGPPPNLAELIPEGSVHVDHWELTSTPAPGDLSYEPEGTFEPLLDAAALERGVRVTRSGSLRCVARETARFYVEHGAWPTDRLTRYLLAACGSSTIAIGQAGTGGSIDARASEEQLLEQAAPDLQAAIAPGLVDGALVGLGFARRGDDLALVVVNARPLMRVEPPEAPGVDGEAVIRGTLLSEDANVVVALVNHGSRDVARCRTNPGFALPVVELRCPMAPDDATALVQIRTATVSRVLSRHVATVLLRRTPNAVPTFDASLIGEASPITDPATAGALVVERLNAVRAEEGRSPVALAPAQSGVHTRVAPYLLGNTDAEAQDTLSLGLLAGWEIEHGTIRWADIVGEITVGGVDIAQWLGNALSQPTGRHVLLRDDVHQVAVGAVPVPERDALGLVISTYAFFEDVDRAASAELVFARITEARTARGLPPPRRVEGLARLDAHAAAVAEGTELPNAAFHAALDEEGRRAGRSLRGMVVETVDLQSGALPEELFEHRDLSLGVAVSHTRAAGAAWGQYVVFLVFA